MPNCSRPILLYFFVLFSISSEELFNALPRQVRPGHFFFFSFLVSAWRALLSFSLCEDKQALHELVHPRSPRLRHE
jgi:hypothetical protein